MKALVFTRLGVVEILDVPEAIAGPEEVVVHVDRAGICGSELHGISTPGFRVPPLILGHVAAFANVESRAKYPLLPLRVVLNRTRGGAALAMLFASVGMFGVFLFLTYYLQDTLRFSPVKTGIAYLPMVAALVATAQVSNRILLAKVGPKPMVPTGLLVAAVGMFGLHLLGPHSSYVTHVLPYLLVLGLGFGLSIAPSFSVGTVGLAPHDAGVGSATLNTAQQVGGSIGTSLLNTLAASAATPYLVGRALTPTNVQGSLIHSYTTAFCGHHCSSSWELSLPVWCCSVAA
jgi:hypothetical protein